MRVFPDILIKRRGIIKTAITKIETFLNNNKNKLIGKYEYVVQLERLIEIFGKHEKIQDKFELWNEEAYTLDIIETENKYYSLTALLKSLIERKDENTYNNKNIIRKTPSFVKI